MSAGSNCFLDNQFQRLRVAERLSERRRNTDGDLDECVVRSRGWKWVEVVGELFRTIKVIVV